MQYDEKLIKNIINIQKYTIQLCGLIGSIYSNNYSF